MPPGSDTDTVPEHPFSRDMRLRRQADFDRIHRGNVYAADEVLVVRGAANDQARTRIGISLSRKVGNAVVRNRWKRLVREAFRLQRDQLPVGLDIVIRPRRGGVAEFQSICRSLKQLTQRIDRQLRKGKR